MAHYYEVNTDGVEEKPCYHKVKRYLEAQEYSEGASINDKKFLWRFLSKFFLSNMILYKIMLLIKNLAENLIRNFLSLIDAPLGYS